MKKVTSIPLDMGLEEKDGTRLKFIHGAIANGAMAFLKQEYKFLTIFMVAFAAIIAILIDDTHTEDTREGIYTALAFLFGGAISIASGFFRSRPRLCFEVLKSPKNWDRFRPGSPSLWGPPTLNTSGRFSDSTRITLAPWSARYLAEMGPTPTQAKSATRIPSKGSASEPDACGKLF